MMRNIFRKKTPKEKATAAGKPYVDVIGMDMENPNDIHSGSFELEWNELFIMDLIKNGYKGKTPEQLVDQWFQTVCRNIVLETFEKEEAMRKSGLGMTERTDLGAGKTEIK